MGEYSAALTGVARITPSGLSCVSMTASASLPGTASSSASRVACSVQCWIMASCTERTAVSSTVMLPALCASQCHGIGDGDEIHIAQRAQ